MSFAWFLLALLVYLFTPRSEKGEATREARGAQQDVVYLKHGNQLRFLAENPRSFASRAVVVDFRSSP